MPGAELLKELFDEKRIRVLQVFIQKPQDEFVLKEVVRKAKVPLATTYRILHQLAEKGLLSASTHKHLTVYRLADSEDARYLSQLLYEKPVPIARFVDVIASLPGIEQALMHGKATESRANIVIIGTGIDKDLINATVAQIREDDHFTITHLILEPEQYQMLEAMGQFSGSKTVLFAR